MRKPFEHYKPELHYMRGPGPMWVKKHGRAEAITSDRDRAAPTLVEAIARTMRQVQSAAMDAPVPDGRVAPVSRQCVRLLD